MTNISFSERGPWTSQWGPAAGDFANFSGPLSQRGHVIESSVYQLFQQIERTMESAFQEIDRRMTIIELKVAVIEANQRASSSDLHPSSSDLHPSSFRWSSSRKSSSSSGSHSNGTGRCKRTPSDLQVAIHRIQLCY